MRVVAHERKIGNDKECTPLVKGGRVEEQYERAIDRQPGTRPIPNHAPLPTTRLRHSQATPSCCLENDWYWSWLWSCTACNR